MGPAHRQARKNEKRPPLPEGQQTGEVEAPRGVAPPRKKRKLQDLKPDQDLKLKWSARRARPVAPPSPSASQKADGARVHLHPKEPVSAGPPGLTGPPRAAGPPGLTGLPHPVRRTRTCPAQRHAGWNGTLDLSSHWSRTSRTPVQEDRRYEGRSSQKCDPRMFFFCSNRQCPRRQAKQEQMRIKMILRARRGTEVAQRKRLKNMIKMNGISPSTRRRRI